MYDDLPQRQLEAAEILEQFCRHGFGDTSVATLIPLPCSCMGTKTAVQLNDQAEL